MNPIFRARDGYIGDESMTLKSMALDGEIQMQGKGYKFSYSIPSDTSIQEK